MTWNYNPEVRITLNMTLIIIENIEQFKRR